MAYEARATDRIRAAVAGSEPLRAAWRVFWVSRAAIAAVAVFAALTVGSGGLPERNAEKFDAPALTHPFGGLGDTLLSPLARWDSVWYLSIADSGYDGAAREAFFPLYPLLRGRLARRRRGPRRRCSLAAYLVSLAALLGALYLLWRLVCARARAAATRPRRCCCSPSFPGALFFGAPYSESLFLLVSVGAFYAARTGHWAWAGALAGLRVGHPQRGRPAAAAAGDHVVAGRAALEARRRLARAGPRRASRRTRVYLELAIGDGLAFLQVQEAWLRHFAGPLGGAWDATVAAFDGARAPDRRRRPAAPLGGDERDALRLHGLRRSWPAWACCAGFRSPTAPTWWPRSCCRCPSRSSRSR